jgi:uncharacterized protein RhaS with RHS repeats
MFCCERRPESNWQRLAAAADAPVYANYSYDQADRVTQIVDQAGGLPSSTGNTRAFTYNGFDEVLTETDSPKSATITYTYDGEGRAKTLAVSGQPTVTYTWNNAHQITNVTNGTLSAVVAYDTAGAARVSPYPTA